eukprot:TRINITY_DN65758_c8_g2_i2.p1 TRINITY_DN65758_c8_g2~~TRINITY_DN65758_c8_g2_i2.p1  ORF type:complete len:271 (-),score=158.63 TRINITY_DN65758_c8_g2_i2:1088-1861(-)
MARAAEKAQTMLSRFFRYKQELGKEKRPTRRPHLASLVSDVREAQRWRRQIVGEIAQEVSRIQDAGMGEHQVRDLNDHINKLFREKHHWELRIRELGGPDHVKSSMASGIMETEHGHSVIEHEGYFYFGAARDLPGVRELFEQKKRDNIPKKKRGEIAKMVDADYFGYGDEEDGLLLRLEAEVEERERAKAIVASRLERIQNDKADDGDDQATAMDESNDDDADDDSNDNNHNNKSNKRTNSPLRRQCSFSSRQRSH